MLNRGLGLGGWLVAIGAALLGAGILLLLVKLVMLLSWFAEIVALAGLIILTIGAVLVRRRGARHESEDEIPYF